MTVMWICFAVAVACIVVGVLSFLQKGVLLNNAYLYASKEEREAISKKPYYIQSGVVFCLIAVVFVFNGVALLLKNDALFGGAHVTMAATLVYAIVSSVVIEKRKKKGDDDVG